MGSSEICDRLRTGLLAVMRQKDHLAFRAIRSALTAIANAEAVHDALRPRMTRRFTYRSPTDDGNPSYADWEWRVEPEGDGATVSVTVDVNPKTF